jgi:hypothetical protein
VHANSDGVLQYLGGGYHIVEQADFSKVEAVREVKSQKIITQRIRNKPQECNLSFDFQASVTIFDLRDRQAGIRQELLQRNAGFLGSGIGKPRIELHIPGLRLSKTIGRPATRLALRFERFKSLA